MRLIPKHQTILNKWVSRVQIANISSNHPWHPSGLSSNWPSWGLLMLPRLVMSWNRGNQKNNPTYLVVSTLLKNMLVKLDHFARDWGENQKYLKPPPSYIFGKKRSPTKWFWLAGFSGVQLSAILILDDPMCFGWIVRKKAKELVPKWWGRPW